MKNPSTWTPYRDIDTRAVEVLQSRMSVHARNTGCDKVQSYNMMLCSPWIVPSRVRLPRCFVFAISEFKALFKPSLAGRFEKQKRTQRLNKYANKGYVVHSRSAQVCTSGIWSACCILLH